MYRFYDAWLILYPAITSSCRPDQNFCVGIRRVLKTGLYLIILNFLVTLLFSFYFISVLGHMVNFLIYTFEIENAMKLYIFFFRSLNIMLCKIEMTLKGISY